MAADAFQNNVYCYKCFHNLVIFIIDVPENKQTVKQIPSGGIVKGNAVTLSCSVEGGNPLPTLSWDCIGDILNSTSDNTANYSLKLNVQKDDNGKVCNCTAMHMIASYRPSIQHSLVVYCKYISYQKVVCVLTKQYTYNIS